MKNHKVLFALTLASAIIFASCSTNMPKQELVLVANNKIDCEDTTSPYVRLKGDPHGGNYYTRADSSNQFGSAFTYNIPDSLVLTGFKVYVNFWARTEVPTTKNSIAIAIQDGENTPFWAEILLKDHTLEKGKWQNISDSINIPAETISKPGLTLKVFPFCGKSVEAADYDDIDVTVKKVVLKL